MKNHYQTLNIQIDATQDEIKKSYRKLALKFHPDKNGGKQFYVEKFSEIQQAYQTLSNIQKRKVYDQFWKIHSDEHNEFFTTEESYHQNERDRSSIFIFLSAVFIIIGTILSIYYGVK